MNVVAVTADDQVVIIEQYRHGFGEVTLELPGGLVDDGEAPLDAGVRELAEETGFAGQDARVIGVVSPNPAIQANRCHTVLVTDCVRRQRKRLDSTEEMETRLVPLADVPVLVRRGVIHHALVVGAFHHYTLL